MRQRQREGSSRDDRRRGYGSSSSRYYYYDCSPRRRGECGPGRESSTKSHREEGDVAAAVAVNTTTTTSAAGGGAAAAIPTGFPGGGGTTVVTLPGAARRRQMVAGHRAPLPPIRTNHHNTVRNPNLGGGSWTPTKLTPGWPSSASPTRRERIKRAGGALSPMGRFRVGVAGVGATRGFFSTLDGAERARGAGAGSGPAVGSAQEKAMVLERKEGRQRHPGPTLQGINGHGPASSAMLALRPDRGGPTLVSPHICIGGREDAKDAERLKEMGVTHVLNCARQLPSAHPTDFIHQRLEIIDTSDQDLGPFHKPGVQFLRHVETCGGRALVHCIAGCSRSVSIVLLHLMESHRIRLKTAYEHVRNHRMVAQPNEGFRFQLATAEIKIFGASSVSRDGDTCWNFYQWNEVKHVVPHHAIENPQACGCSVA